MTSSVLCSGGAGGRGDGEDVNREKRMDSSTRLLDDVCHLNVSTGVPSITLTAYRESFVHRFKLLDKSTCCVRLWNHAHGLPP